MLHKHINISTLQLDLESEFIAKLKLITSYFESRMNGATAHQMQSSAPADQKYRLNYGISLGDMKLLAQSIKADENISLSNADYDNLWNTDIREAMLLALILIPEHLITPQRILNWISATHTTEMSEMLPFLTAWKTTDPSQLLTSITSTLSPEKPTTLQSPSHIHLIAYAYTLGRLLQHNRIPRTDNSVTTLASFLLPILPQQSSSTLFLHSQLPE